MERGRRWRGPETRQIDIICILDGHWLANGRVAVPNLCVVVPNLRISCVVQVLDGCFFNLWLEYFFACVEKCCQGQSKTKIRYSLKFVRLLKICCVAKVLPRFASIFGHLPSVSHAYKMLSGASKNNTKLKNYSLRICSDFVASPVSFQHLR